MRPPIACAAGHADQWPRLPVKSSWRSISGALKSSLDPRTRGPSNPIIVHLWFLFPMTLDLILSKGTVRDGTGRDGFVASVAVRDGRIAAVGDLAGASAARTVDCTGKVVAPGFIDMHSHSDWGIPQSDHGPVLAPLLEQGTTPIVAGNCGCSPAPYLPGNRALLPQVGRMLHDRDLNYA